MSEPVQQEGTIDELWVFLHECLNEGPVRVLFEKADGTMREMECTTNAAYIDYEFKKSATGSEGEPVPVEEQTHFTVWDIEAKGWRKLTKGKIHEVSLLEDSDNG